MNSFDRRRDGKKTASGPSPRNSVDAAAEFILGPREAGPGGGRLEEQALAQARKREQARRLMLEA
jgi:hypothetical protein